MPERTFVNVARVNLFPWRSKKRPGLRANWIKFSAGLLEWLVLVMWFKTPTSVSYPAALICLLFVCLVAAAGYRNYQFYKAEQDLSSGWVIAMIGTGLALCVLFVFAGARVQMLWSGILMFAFLACLTGITVTSWHLSGRPTYNISRLRPRTKSESEDKPETPGGGESSSKEKARA